LLVLNANSRPVSSAQSTTHRHLHQQVARHTHSVFLKPINDVNKRAFDQSMAAWNQAGNAPLILDAGCGVGLSSRYLAQQTPSHFVIGVDQSADRLGRGVEWPYAVPLNMVLIRADLVDYWRLLHQAGVALARHYVLYPNPWPKIGQLSRRWHGHAVFPTVAALGGEFECRSNWSIYIEECAAALTQLTTLPVVAEPYITAAPITPFEKKYQASGHALWRCRVRLERR